MTLDEPALSEYEKRLIPREYSSALRELAANLMRIAAGAGKPYAVPSELARLVNAYCDVRNKLNELPQTATELHLEPWREAVGEDRFLDEIERYALRRAAAKMLGQDVQVRRNDNELHGAINSFNDYIEKRRRKNGC